MVSTWQPPASSRISQLSAPELKPVLKRLLECPDSLLPKLASATHDALRNTPATTFAQLTNLSRKAVDDARWPVEDIKGLVGGHPRIGAPTSATSNISQESRNEQLKGGNANPETLARTYSSDGDYDQAELGQLLTWPLSPGLDRLNNLYESRYPGLAFVTHVAGRSRAAVADELEGLLGPEVVAPGVSPDLFPSHLVVVEGSLAWQKELQRGYDALWRIALDRASKMQATSVDSKM